MAPLKILLCGDVLGRLNQLFKRVSSVNKAAGPFDALLCVGQFFPDSIEGLEEFSGYVEGRSKIPIPTYFIGDYGAGSPKILSEVLKDPSNKGFKMEGLRVCDNLYWLKGSGKFSLHGTCTAHAISHSFIQRVDRWNDHLDFLSSRISTLYGLFWLH